MTTLLQLLNELTMQQYMQHQIAVARAVAKSLKMTEDDLLMKTKFAELYAQAVDRNKDKIPNVNDIVSKLEKQLSA